CFSSARSVRRALLPNAPGPPGTAQYTIVPSEKSVRREARDEKRRWLRRSAAPSSDTREYRPQRLRKAAPTVEPAPPPEWLRPRSLQEQEVARNHCAHSPSPGSGAAPAEVPVRRQSNPIDLRHGPSPALRALRRSQDRVARRDLLHRAPC